MILVLTPNLLPNFDRNTTWFIGFQYYGDMVYVAFVHKLFKSIM